MPTRARLATQLAGSVAVATVLATVLTFLIGPQPPQRPQRVSGDEALAARLAAALPTGVHTATAALIEDNGNRVTFAGLGQPGGRADEHTRFEIGSVGKALTGMLLADAAERGQVSLDTRAGSLVPGLGRATLADLSTHHSGLPRLARDPGLLAKAFSSQLTGANPYSSSPQQVLAAARSAEAEGGAGFAYSNLGAATLGQVLATALGTAYPQALHERILQPLGLSETTVVSRPEDLPPERATGRSRTGRVQAAWIGAGYAPAGVGLWSTTSDLARLLSALLKADAPGASATRPRAATDSADGRIGLGWFTSKTHGRTVTWHNGGTGGFRAYVGYDAAAGRGIAVLAATTRDIDEAALSVLSDGS
jgi:CubicO group peptidase (beta-lactamase class C family)